MGFFGDLLGKVREGANWVLGKAKGVGNAIVSGIGKAKGVVDFVKRGADFVRNIPVLGDIVKNTPILSNIGNAIDTAHARMGTINTTANSINGLVQRAPDRI